jgi:uncharacterized membrane protein YqhA
MDTRRFERQVAIGARFVTFTAVLASTIGALLMIFIGFKETIAAFSEQVAPQDGALKPDDASAIHLISALDRFLMAIVLLYFAYGIYLLFVRPERLSEDLGVPPWLNVEGIGQLKQTLAEVIVVVLFVLFLRVALETFSAQSPELTWQEGLKILLLPLSILMLSAALKLAELHPKSRKPDNRKP